MKVSYKCYYKTKTEEKKPVDPFDIAHAAEDHSVCNDPVTIVAPPSKSVAHRLLIGAALSKDTSHVRGIEMSCDIQATINCLKAIGARIDITESETVKGLYDACINGLDLSIRCMEPAGDLGSDKEIVLDCNESGSTLRFMIPIVTLLYSAGIAPSSVPVRLTGSRKLLSRPLDVYDEIFKYTYVSFSHNDTAVRVLGDLRSGDYRIAGNISSQFITGLLFTMPLLKGDSILNIVPPVESRSYINITMGILREFGIDVRWEGENAIYVPGDQRYKGIDKVVESDWSNGGILLTMKRMYEPFGADIEITGLDPNSRQGDRVVEQMLDDIDADRVIDISDCPDLGPILLTYMAYKGGGMMKGTARLSIKESDRGNSMREELSKFGACVMVKNNDISVVAPDGLSAPDRAVDSHNDHRVAMSMAALLGIYGGSVDDAGAVNKSFPSFWDVVRSMGFKLDIEE